MSAHSEYDHNEDFCGCGGVGPRRPRYTMIAEPSQWTNPRFEAVGLSELHGGIENLAEGRTFITTVDAIREWRAAVRGECRKCGRVLPARSTIPGLFATRRRDEAERIVVEYAGQPKAWMSRFAGSSTRMIFVAPDAGGSA